ncbi:MAG: hypothetical protein QMD43_08745 [Thermodesulfovibrio sp.]|uniref:hypothetical protein n=1 Tax=unclassified Thermodesulfovibrio TaxID=2645936 RepID=UPI00083B48C8|nr:MULTISPECIES: hypothetical protein [unclassified Thermodesulfovibrio]MDI1471517.1 hypothetical protein [Thermodesulfovibrio sp. 1176]MDI6715089.1 hypothetical protein [Thermodesulfovibrio sp.]
MKKKKKEKIVEYPEREEKIYPLSEELLMRRIRELERLLSEKSQKQKKQRKLRGTLSAKKRNKTKESS